MTTGQNIKKDAVVSDKEELDEMLFLSTENYMEYPVRVNLTKSVNMTIKLFKQIKCVYNHSLYDWIGS